MRNLLFLVFCFSTLSVSNVYSQKKNILVVIDPGHGGHDHGHLASNSALPPEKDLNLKIANYFGEYIEKYLQNVTVMYTRTSDVYPSLNDRVSKANSNNADYFISIHCNGNDRKSVRGTETHVHTMSLKKSVSLATSIEKQFSQRAGRKSRGVKDMKDLTHTLQVLKYTNMTSVLVECGFITNTREANYLNTTNGQEIIASAIFRGFRTEIQKEFPSITFVRPPSETPQGTQASQGKYTIQIMSSINPIDTDDKAFKTLKKDVVRIKLNTTNKYKYVYTVGVYANKAAAKEDLDKVKKRGYKDAFVTKS